MDNPHAINSARNLVEANFCAILANPVAPPDLSTNSNTPPKTNANKTTGV